MFLFCAHAEAATLTVGPGKTYAMPCDAIAAAQPGDTVAVDAGSYDGDTCAWSTDNLTIMGVNGRARIDLTGVTPSQQKGIFTIAAPNATIENFELSGATISANAGNNGAGIRHQGTNLTVRNCYFHDNQDGILGAPSTPLTGQVLIESSEFADNGAGDGYSHNMYLNNYAQFTLRYSYTHGAKVGHLVKSRALVTLLYANRITDEAGTTASYEVDVPNGGTAYLIGNIIEQSMATQNPTIITFAEEGVPNGYDTHLFVINNTVLNTLGSGTFVNDATQTPAVLTNNIFWNGGTVSAQMGDTETTNFVSKTMGDPMFVNEAAFDVHLLAGSPCIDKGSDPGANGMMSLAPMFEYVDPLASEPRSILGAAIDIGAYEFVPAGSADMTAPIDSMDAAANSIDAATHSVDAATSPVDQAGSAADASAAGATPHGCSCEIGGHRGADSSGSALAGFSLLLALALRPKRSRSSRATDEDLREAHFIF